MEGSHSTLFASSIQQSPEPMSRRQSKAQSTHDQTVYDHDPLPDRELHRQAPGAYATPARSFFEPDSSDNESPIEQDRNQSPSLYDQGSGTSHTDMSQVGGQANNTYVRTNELPADLDDLSRLVKGNDIFKRQQSNQGPLDSNTYVDWNPSFYEPTPNKLDTAWDDLTFNTNPYSNSTLYPRANISDPQIQPKLSRDTQEQLLKMYRMTMNAIVYGETSPESKQNLNLAAPKRFDFDESFGSFKSPASPTRPERPHSDVDSFLVNHPPDQSLRSNVSAPTPILKPPPIPTDPLPSDPRAGAKRSLSSPPVPEQRRSSMKHVSMAPPPIRSDKPNYKAPEQYTPFPFINKPEPVVLTPVIPIIPPAPPITSLPPMPPIPPDTQPITSLESSTSSPNANRASRISIRARSRSPASSNSKRRQSRQRQNPYSIHNPPVTSTPTTSSSILRLFVRRRNAPNGRRTALISIPRDAPTVTGTERGNEKHFASLVFDDAVLFTQLRERYFGTLLGPSAVSRAWCRYLSARSLKRVRLVVDGRVPEWRRVDEDGGVPEAELMGRFRSPKGARGAYSWVHWALRVADSTNGESACRLSRDIKDLRRASGNGFGGVERQRDVSGSTLEERREASGRQASKGLEFVEGWCVWRTVSAATVVLLAAVAVCLLWIVLGPASSSDWLGNVFDQEARSQRIGPACLLAVLVLLLGWTGVAAWMGVSWLVM